MTVEVILIGQQQNVVEMWNNLFVILEVFYLNQSFSKDFLTKALISSSRLLKSKSKSSKTSKIRAISNKCIREISPVC